MHVGRVIQYMEDVAMCTTCNNLQILTFTEAARILGKCPRTISRWSKKGVIKTVTIGGRSGILYSDLVGAVEAAKQKSANKNLDE